jgi:hypothetical protein
MTVTDPVRTLIDARTTPVTITTLPATGAMATQTAQPVAAAVRTLRVTTVPRQRRTPRALIYGPAGLALVATTGFVLGVTGIGWDTAVDIATTALTLLFVALLLSAIGSGRVHCPGCRR